MRTVFTICIVLSIWINSWGQSKVAGVYHGQVKNDSGSIDVTFNLYDNSTYIITVESVGLCVYDSIVFAGNWVSKGGWIYFRPDESGGFDFDNTRGRDHRRRTLRMGREGYYYSLKLIRSKDDPDRLWFHIANDCYEQYWDSHYVEKRE